MPEFTAELFFQVLSIVLIDILLAGDNAVVIAMAVKSLEGRQRRMGVIIGAGVAVVLRIVLTFFAAQLLQVSWLKFTGGILIFWIAIKLLTEAAGDELDDNKPVHNLWHAIWFILVADITMSMDNVLAVAGASKGSLGLLIFGLGLSIPFVVFTSNLLSTLMDKYPMVLWIGAAILGRVGAEMMITDPVIRRVFHPTKAVEIAAEVAGVVLVVMVSKLLIRRRALA